ncbi:MAG: OmcA/MtrC family decaheme c-type cytochrome [Burkholderiales bacterium]|nr:OmcA/MtrC family decaheme c-type cytochrome [Burkholderiales bacterium]
MKYSNLLSKTRTSYRWVNFAAAGLLALGLAGCGGSSSSDTTTTPPPATGGGTPATAAAAITAAAAVAANDTGTTPTAAFAVVQDAGIAPVTVNSPPKVNFTVISDGAVKKDLTLSNVAFIIARLDKGTSGTPDQWVSYTTRTETATAGVGPGGTPALATATQATTDTEAEGSLVYNDAGYYTYTFSTDITAATGYDPTKTHRVAIQLSYTNAAGATVLANPYFDFTIGTDGKAVAVTDTSLDHKVVDITSCNECHEKLALHGGGRIDTQYCVLCHNAGTTDANSGNVLDFRIMVHKIHAGEHLKSWFGTDYTIWGYRDGENDYAEVGFPQSLANCTKCHDNTKAAQADNWKSVPSRAACGSCHAGINFATGKGLTIADAEAGGITESTYGHVGGIQTDDSACHICHTATNIPTVHVAVASGETSQSNLPAGAAKFSYEIKDVTVAGASGAKKATVVFRILKDGAVVTLNPFTTGATQMITDFNDGPRIYLAYSQPQDGITAPADFNNAGGSASGVTLNSTTGPWRTGGLTGPDADGYYSVTHTTTIPDNASMVTAFVGYSFTQMNLAAYPAGLGLSTPIVTKVATGYTGRRAIVETAKCSKCHDQLGVDPNFHGGARNDATICAFCHNPNAGTNSGWSWDSSAFIHGIHGASKRTVPFTWTASSAAYNYSMVAYPGILKNCETCHVAGSYDFSGTDNAAAVPNRLYRTVAEGTTVTATFDTSPYIAQTAGTAYGASWTPTTPAAATNLVNSPIAAACFSCHDSSTAQTHMSQDGGGSIYEARSTAMLKTENCLFCHGSGKLVDIKVQHAK